MRDINYRVQGFLKETRQRQTQEVNARNLEGTFRGFKLDEIQIVATIKTQQELEDFITFLYESVPCFQNW